jgi:hypothetical protein
MSLEELTAVGTAFDIDEADLRRALGVLLDPNHRVELRLLPSGRSLFFAGNDPDALVAAVHKHADSPGIYYTLNPVMDDLTVTAKDKHVVRRRLFLIDIDPTRPASFAKFASTDDEKAAAMIVAKDVVRGLNQLEWPEPIMIDSGNGYHLLYCIDLPNDAPSRFLLKNLLLTLARRHDLQSATIDKSVHNASRIAKLPGTWAAMKKAAPGRPHRRCQVLSIPPTIRTVTAQQLHETLAALAPAKKRTPRLPSRIRPVVNFSTACTR